MTQTTHLPLHGLRVVDLTTGIASMTGRFLADLGADVILIEPPTGSPDRKAGPVYRGHSLRFAVANANKRGITVDLETRPGVQRLLKLTEVADIVLESYPPGGLAELGVAPDVMRAGNPRLVVVSITPFGLTGPYRDYRGGEAVFAAMSSLVTRSGAAGREPLLPPGEMASQTAAVDCAYAALLAWSKAEASGVGSHLDCSLFDMVVQNFDPGLGMTGTASMSKSMIDAPPGRPDASMLYPILRCTDGAVRMFIGSAKQWRALLTWMGNPPDLSAPEFDSMLTRTTRWPEIGPQLQRFMSELTCAEAMESAERHGVALTTVRTPREVLVSDHVASRASFAIAEIAPGVTGAIANGYAEINCERAGFRHRAPQLGEHDDAGGWQARPVRSGDDGDPSAPLDGIRVLDLGVIVVGSETGRLLADQGADVIKVENRAFPDGARQGDRPGRCGRVFAVGNRGKRSIGLNLRHQDGIALFCDLVRASDVVLTNFKPGTMDSLGLSYERLREVNPGVIFVDSSALGRSGPWSQRMGYGPLVRAGVGLTALWRHPGDPDAYGDATTVYPDHAAAHVAAAVIVAALAGRRRTGEGARISIAQMETVFCQLAQEFLRESLEPGSLVVRGEGEDVLSETLLPCAGDDAFCAVVLEDAADAAALAAAIGVTGQSPDRKELWSLAAQWTRSLTPREAQERLQNCGIAAGAAIHAKDLLADPHLDDRGQIGRLEQPGHREPIPVFLGPVRLGGTDGAGLRPAPLMAEHTRQVLTDILGIGADDQSKLLAEDVVFVEQGS